MLDTNVQSSPIAALPDIEQFWDYDRPGETETTFREILTRVEAIGGDKPYQVELLTQIARTEGLQHRFDAAHRTLDRAGAILKRHASPRADVRCLLERGRLFNSCGERASAIPMFEEAYARAQATGEESLAVDAAHMLGICETPEKAMEWNLHAFAAAEASEDPRARRWVGLLLNNIGWTHHDQGNFLTALDFFRRALAFRVQQGNVRQIRIARWAVARALRSLKRVDEALIMQRELLKQWKNTGEEDGYVYEELGECLMALGNGQAYKWFLEAYRVLSTDPWLSEREPERMHRLKELAAG